MKDIEINTVIKFCSFDELPTKAQTLVNKAKEATQKSYAPYSNFNVGAALELDNGLIITGANQENASFPVTMCAERSAIFNAQSTHPELAITAIAIAARNIDGFVENPVTPCGVCRQALLEMEQRYRRNILIYLYGTLGIYVINSIKDLLPLSFDSF